jgi:rubrerythrin
MAKAGASKNEKSGGTVNPYTTAGTPTEEQWEVLNELVSEPYDKDKVDEHTRLRLILAYGMENEQWYFYHAMARHTADENLKKQLALIRRAEDQHRSETSFYFDPDASFPQQTIAIEHLAVALTAAVAMREPDSYVKKGFDYALLEDYDHLYRFSLLLKRRERKEASEITQGLVDILPGRPTWLEHLHPLDTTRDFYDASKASPLTKLNLHCVLGAEQQTRQYYASDGYWLKDPIARRLYAEIGQIEEQHVTHYESFLDPRTSWLEMALDHEYLEVYTYAGFLQQEKDEQVKELWQEHLGHELQHFQAWARLYEQTGKDPRQLWPEQLPPPIAMEDSKAINAYVKKVLEEQVDLRASGKTFVPLANLPENWPTGPYQQQIEVEEAASTRFQES